MGTLHIDTLGTSFVMQANEDEEYLNKLMDYYKKIVNQVETDSKLRDPLKTAIIATTHVTVFFIIIFRPFS